MENGFENLNTQRKRMITKKHSFFKAWIRFNLTSWFCILFFSMLECKYLKITKPGPKRLLFDFEVSEVKQYFSNSMKMEL